MTSVQVDFDALVRDYLQNLNVSLRGFKPAEEFEFLNAWVPSDDPTDSLIDLIEHGREARLARLTVRLGPATAAQLDFSRIEAGAGPLQRREEGDQTVLVFALDGTPELAIHASYRKGLLEVLARVVHAQALQPVEGQQLVAATEEGITLMALIDPARHTVSRAAFHGGPSPVQRGLLECLCTVMERKPIQECADHALIAVEYRLRDRQQPPVAGLVTPENADPAFALPQRLVRALLAEYRAVTGYRESRNFYDIPCSDRWNRMTEAQRCAAVKAALEARGASGRLELVGMDGPKRAVFRLAPEVSSADRQRLLAELEDHLRSTLEPALQLVAEVRSDANILRLPTMKKNP
jgi:hypothetical protein